MRLTSKLGIVFAVLLMVSAADTAIIYNFQNSLKTDAAIIDAAGRDRMLSQRIGLFAEQVLQGHDEVRPLLRDMIDLHDVSFRALQDGGIAPGISQDRVLPATIDRIKPLTESVGNLWNDYQRNAQIIADEPRLASGQPNQVALNALEFIESNASEMLNRNDKLTKAYVAESESKQRNTNVALFAILIINGLAVGSGFIVARSLVHALEVVDKAKTEFVSLASHQLLTPLTSVRWNAEMLLNGDMGALKQKQQAAVHEIYHTNKQMRDLVNGFLNLSRIEMGVFVVEPEPVNFARVCENVLAELKPRILEKNQTVVKNFSDKLLRIPADPNLLRIIFQNFLSNAIKYTPDHGQIAVAIKIEDREIVVTVTNNGPGIPTKDQPKIFNKMFRAGNAASIDPDGNGLGLYLVREIVKNSGGRVWFESTPDRNTSFYIAFPLSGMKRKSGTKPLS